MQPPIPGPPAPRPAPDVRPGVVIADKYRIEKELGRGGFGIVVKAHHLQLDQAVAIKVLTEGEGTDTDWEEDAARFRREAMATAALRGDHVVRVLDVDVLPSGCPYIVMEYLEGETLHDIVHTRGPLSIAEGVDIAMQVLAALAEAHALGIVHRDLKPANVFVANAGGGTTVVKVLDFGVSKMLEAISNPITRTGAVIGTVAYMSPEQMLDAKRVDGRADLWSVGLILFEALSRKLPFGESSSPTVVTAILGKPPIPLAQFRPDLPPPLIGAIMRLLEKIPEQRFSTAVEVAYAFMPFASPRSRFAFDAIRRAPPPQGAAAPLPSGMVPTARGRVQKVSTAPPRSGPASVPRPAPKKSSSALGIILAFALSGAALGVIAAITFTMRPTWLSLPVKDPIATAPSTAPSAPLAAVSASAPPVASSAPSPSTVPSASVVSSATHSASVKGGGGTRPLPSPSSSAKNPCDPPYVFDPTTNIKKYKPECL